MIRHHLPITRLVALLCIVLPLLFISNVSAQDAPAEIEFRISSYTCGVDPGQVSPAAGNIPSSCTPDVGASASVALQDGTAVGTCTTDASGLCILMAPNEATVVVTLDVSTLAGAVAPRENPITTEVVTEFAGALFINLPAAPVPTAVPSDAPTDLPDTGSGAAADTSQALLVVVMGLILGLASAGAAIRMRENIVNHA